MLVVLTYCDGGILWWGFGRTPYFRIYSRSGLRDFYKQAVAQTHRASPAL